MQQDNRSNIYEDEIDLKELFLTIWNKKIFIAVFTSIVTIIAIGYAFLKNPTPIYEGKLYLEIGKIQDKNFAPTVIELPADISKIVDIKFNNIEEELKNNDLGLTIQLAEGSTKILEVIFKDYDKVKIKKELEEVKNFIVDKHKQEAKYYENVIMTNQIGNTIINDKPINAPKKALIISVAFVTGFILSIFLVFFINFIRTSNEN